LEVLLGLLLLKQEDFCLGENGSRPNEKIFAQESIKKLKTLFLLLKA